MHCWLLTRYSTGQLRSLAVPTRGLERIPSNIIHSLAR